MITEITLGNKGNKVFKIGDDTALGTIKEFFTAGGELCFFTEQNNFFPVRYLIGC